jgi:hypothetical protein
MALNKTHFSLSEKADFQKNSPLCGDLSAQAQLSL